MEFRTPEPLKKEHEELHTELADAIKAGGSIGEAAKAVAQIMHPHFIKEEEYALPPLGILTSLAKEHILQEMRDVLSMTERLKEDLPKMLEEHKAIIAKLRNLADAAKKENKIKYAAFAEKLILHAQTEEEIMYPAAIMAGEYIKLKLRK